MDLVEIASGWLKVEARDETGGATSFGLKPPITALCNIMTQQNAPGPEASRQRTDSFVSQFAS